MKQSILPMFVLILLSISLSGCGDASAPPLPLPPEREKISKSKGDSVTPTARVKAGPVENIDKDERIQAAMLTQAVDPITQEIKLFKAQVRGAFDGKEFDALEKQAAELRKSKALFRDGSWKLYHFYYGVDNRFHTGEAGFLTDLETHREWEKAYPASLTQRTALMNLLIDYAWEARGSGRADTVTEEKWKKFGSRLNLAKDTYFKAEAVQDNDPALYYNALSVAMGMSAGKEVFDQMVEKSRKIDPTFYHTEQKRAYTLLPRWMGEKGDWEAFAVEAANVENGLGDETFARIIISMQKYYADVFRDAAKPSWAKTKKGLVILREKYPDSIVLDNYCAKLATGKDRNYAKASFDRLGDQYITWVWKKPERFVHFRGWAYTGKW